jgi:hypothetical protein
MVKLVTGNQSMPDLVVHQMLGVGGASDGSC